MKKLSEYTGANESMEVLASRVNTETVKSQLYSLYNLNMIVFQYASIAKTFSSCNYDFGMIEILNKNIQDEILCILKKYKGNAGPLVTAVMQPITNIINQFGLTCDECTNYFIVALKEIEKMLYAIYDIVKLKDPETEHQITGLLSCLDHVQCELENCGTHIIQDPACDSIPMEEPTPELLNDMTALQDIPETTED